MPEGFWKNTAESQGHHCGRTQSCAYSATTAQARPRRVGKSRRTLIVAENFVLIHGAWHGGWCWAAVINELDKRGDRAFAVDLPGTNANPLDRAKVNLQVYVDSVIRWIEDRNLRNVILAGH